MSRKSSLDALFGSKPSAKAEPFAAANQPASEPEFAAANSVAASPERRRSGAVRAMGTTLRGLAERADAAASIEAGSSIVSLDVALIDGSFIADRVPDPTDPSIAALVESIRESGQQVPILLRPHPQTPGRYQIAYGHRRVRAAAALSQPVRAVVRPLSDAELVVAQGKENLERRDLSYIERAYFAERLEGHGFPRETISAAMGIGKGDLSTLISVARSVPEAIVAAIGPAPAAGRPRWMALAERIKASPVEAEAAIAKLGFAALPTDARFSAVLNAFSFKAVRVPKAQVWKDGAGRKVARIERDAERFSLAIDRTIEPEFGEYLLTRLPELLAAFKAGKA